MPDSNRPDTLVLGIGNTLLGDDGIGVHVVRALADDPRVTDAELVDGGTLGLRLADCMSGRAHCIVVDAASLDLPPGQMQVLDLEAFERLLATGRRAGVHQAGLLDLASLLRLEGGFPHRFAIVAVQPAYTGWSESLSPPLARAVPHACAEVARIMRQWRQETSHA